MAGERSRLEIGTRVSFSDGMSYEITGAPVGSGGGSLIYPVKRYTKDQDDAMPYALKECYPVSSRYPMIRDEDGQIRPVDQGEEAAAYLQQAKAMMIAEKAITQRIYATGFRSLPILDSSDSAMLSHPDGRETQVHNTYALMESLTDKGMTLEKWLSEHERLTPYQTFHVTEQLLLGLMEVHRQGYLHLDIQSANIFIKGVLSEENDQVILIDFGSARATRDGKTEEITDKVIFSTPPYMSPEMYAHNDGHLQLTASSDIFSVGCLMLYMLTGTLAPAPYKDKEKYLTAWQLRKIDCPKHLLDDIQSVIAKALYNDPAMRYPSAEAMLTDVRTLRQALAPKQADLSGLAYDAFISYKHSPMDSLAAKKLQRALENYRAAVTTGGGKKQIGRIFVDEGELASCADYGSQIEAALKHAGWLIVICSKETKTSRWVNDEIETFLKYHDRSKLLAVLTEDEPEDVYPKALMGDGCEVLAADLREWTAKGGKGAIPKTALMKLAAPLLATTYETLYQRKKLYAMQRLAIWSGAAAVLMVLFLIYALYTGSEIRKNYKAARENEARYLADMALDALAEGDRERARSLNTQVLPEKGEKDYVVPEQLYARNQINYAYKEIGIHYVPMQATDLSEGIEGTFSENGERYYIWNRDNCIAIAPDTGEILWKISCKDIREAAGDLLSTYAKDTFLTIEEMRLSDTGDICLQMRELYVLVDPKTGKIHLEDQNRAKKNFQSAEDLRMNKEKTEIETVTHAEIIGVAKLDEDDTLVCLNSGIIQRITDYDGGNNRVLMAAKITRKPVDFDYDKSHDRIALVTEKQVVFLENTKDEAMQEVDLTGLQLEAEDIISEVTYAEALGEHYRIVTFREGKSIETKAVAIYQTASDTCMYSYRTTEGSMDNIQIRTKNGKAVLVYTETVKKETTMHTITLDDIYMEETQPMTGAGKMICTADMGMYFTIKNGNELRKDDTTVCTARKISKLQMTADEKYLCFRAETAEGAGLFIYDIDNDEIREVSFPEGEEYLSICEVTLSENGHTLCISDRVENIYLCDCEKGEITQTIPAKKDSHADFFRNDSLLIIKDTEKLTVYDIKTMSILSSIDHASNTGALITDNTGTYIEVSEINGYAWDPDTDEGMRMGDTAIFTVDKKGQIFPYVETKYAMISPYGDEISVANTDVLYYGAYYE